MNIVWCELWMWTSASAWYSSSVLCSYSGVINGTISCGYYIVRLVLSSNSLANHGFVLFSPILPCSWSSRIITFYQELHKSRNRIVWTTATSYKNSKMRFHIVRSIAFLVHSKYAEVGKTIFIANYYSRGPDNFTVRMVHSICDTETKNTGLSVPVPGIATEAEAQGYKETKDSKLFA